jgi:hypothetical protein
MTHVDGSLARATRLREGGIIMNKAYLIVSIVLAVETTAAEPLAHACGEPLIDVITEPFDDGRNEGNWGFACPGSFIEDDGGNPGPFLRMTDLEIFAPMARTCRARPSVFRGNYRAQKVFALSVDFKTFSVSYTTDERPLTLVLVNHAGTPGDFSDDLYVFYVGKENIPSVANAGSAEDGWVRYQFEVPSQSTALPQPRSAVEGEPGWVATVGEVFTPAEDPDAIWNTVIQNVDEVIYWWHDPRYFAIFQMWDVGMDNPSIAKCTQ